MLQQRREKQKKEKQREAMRRYIHTPKGLATRKKYNKQNKDKIYEYHSNYMRAKRADARKNKLCIKCFKNKVLVGFVQCEACLQNQKAYMRKK